MKILNVKDDAIYTPVITLKKGNRSIVLVGMSHIGEMRYFTEIQALLDKHDAESYAVLYERHNDSEVFFKHFYGEDVTAQKVWIRLKAAVIRSKNILAEQFALSEQDNSTLQIHSHWIDCDVPEEEMKLTLGEAEKFDIDRLQKMSERIETLTSETLIENVRQSLMEMKKIGVNLKYIRDSSNRVIDQRNDHALKMILAQAEHQNVVTCWGALHLLGIVDTLKKYGYKRSRREWIKVAVIPPPIA